MDYPAAVEAATASVAEMATQGLTAFGRVRALEEEKRKMAECQTEVLKKLAAIEAENARLQRLVAGAGLPPEGVDEGGRLASPGRVALEEAEKELEETRAQLLIDGERLRLLEDRLRKEKDEASAREAEARRAQFDAESRATAATKALRCAESRVLEAERALEEAEARASAAEKRAEEAVKGQEEAAAQAAAALKDREESATREAAALKGKEEADAQVAEVRSLLEKTVADGAAREAALTKAKSELEAREAIARGELEKLRTPDGVMAAFWSGDAEMSKRRSKYNDDVCAFAVYVIRECANVGILDWSGVTSLGIEDIDVLNEKLEAHVPPESEEGASDEEEDSDEEDGSGSKGEDPGA